MPKFNKQQRIEIYKKAILEYKKIIANKSFRKSESIGFCLLLSILGWGGYFGSPIYSDPTKEFPELKPYKPISTLNKMWFSIDKEGAKKRMEILKEIVSKYERHIIYKQLLEAVCKDPETKHGMCWYLYILLGRKWTKIEHYPELVKYKPIELYPGGTWGDSLFFAPCTPKGWETRIKWIIQAIKDTKC